MVSQTSAEPPWIIVARKYLGVEEVRGPGDNPTILGFVTKISAAFPEQASYAGNYEHDDTAWCGLFMTDCFAEVGIRGPFGHSDTDRWLWADSWMTWGKPCEPRVGAVVCFGRHVATVNRLIDADTFEAIGGNQSSPQGGAVTLSRRRWSDVKATRWPDEAESAKIDAAPSPGQRSSLSQKSVDAIVALAASSDLAKYNWDGRGRGPIGYIKGMAVVFGQVYSKLKVGDSSARVMAANVPSSDKDALDLYQPKFNAAGILLNASDVGNLRALFVLLTGLGMRESSGRYCEGRDRSASNTSSDECEAGLFQQSWNSHAASREISKLFDTYSTNRQGFLEIFREGVTPHEGDLENFGSGDGLAFQVLCKQCPAFAVEAAAVGLRVLRNHWGPIKREEAEVNPLADELFRKVQTIVDAQPIDGEVTLPVKIDADLTLVLSFMLQETTMTEDDKALIRQALSSQTLDPTTRQHLLALMAPTPSPVVQPPVANLPALHGFDLSQLLPLIQNPDVQKAIGNLMPILLPAIFALMSGHPMPPVQTPVVKPADPTPAPAPSNVPFNLSAGLGMALASLGLSATGVIGAPAGPDATMTGMLMPIISLAAGAFGIPAPVVSILGNVFSAIIPALKSANKPKAP